MDLADLLPQRGGAAGETGSALGGFLNANYHFGDKDETSREDGFDFDNFGLVGGLDYRFSDGFVGGFALDVNFTDVEVTSFPGGDTESLATGLTLYSSFYQKDAFHVDAHLNATVNSYDTTRRVFIPSNNPAIPTIDTSVAGDADGTQYSAGLGAGWDIRSGAMTYTPYASVEYLSLRIDPYGEDASNALSLQFDQQELKSLQSALGVQFAHAISTQSGVIQPQGHVAWVHEFENDTRSITARYVNDPFNASSFAVPTNDPDRDYFTLGAGISGTFAQGLMAFVNIEGVVGLDEVTNIGVLTGVRGEW
jgi:outer membrane autotransporter protein